MKLAMKLVYLLFVLFIPYNECIGRWDVFSTNTLLQWINNNFVHVSNDIDRNVNFGISTTACDAIHLNMVVRDAAHYPSIRKMNEIKTLHEKIVKSKDPGKFPQLDKWKQLYDLSMADVLSSKGIEEITQLGSRIGKHFKIFLKDFPDRHRLVKFVSSSYQGEINSSKYFEQGLWSQLTEIPTFQSTENDSTVSFSKNCYNYEKQQQDSSKYLEEFNKFSKTSEFVKIIDTLRKKLGMQANLTDADIYLINDWCAYGTYISDDMTWCHLLTDEDRDVLEYGQDLLVSIQDLQKYYKYSYGNPINGKMACPLVRDIFNTIDSSINRTWNYFKKATGSEQSYVGAKFQFADSDTLIPLMTALGMFKDDKALLATNMDVMRDRLFKTSKISSFASSVAFIVYACDNTRRLALGEFHPGQQEFRIQAFVNEQRVPFCKNKYYCLYDWVRETFTDSIDNCNITEVCGAQPVRPEMITPENGACSPSAHILCTHLTLLALSLFILNI